MKAPLYTVNVYSTKLGIARLCRHSCGFMNWAPNPMLIKPMRKIQANLRSPPQ